MKMATHATSTDLGGIFAAGLAAQQLGNRAEGNGYDTIPPMGRRPMGCRVGDHGFARVGRLLVDPANVAELSGAAANHLAGSGLEPRRAGPIPSYRPGDFN